MPNVIQSLKKKRGGAQKLDPEQATALPNNEIFLIAGPSQMPPGNVFADIHWHCSTKQLSSLTCAPSKACF